MLFSARSLSRTLTVFAVLACTTACGGLPLLDVTAEPSSARIYVNGIYQGKGQVIVKPQFSKSRRMVIQAALPGYRPVLKYVEPELYPRGGKLLLDLN